jgi:hypothetical protein
MNHLQIRKNELAPWELEHLELLREEHIRRIESQRTHFTRSQWYSKGRRVVVSNSDAARTMTTRTGHLLHLFSFEQTKEVTQ